MNKPKEYEVWEDTESVTLATKDAIQYQLKNGLIEEGARKIHSFAACTHEEASAIYHLRMGFEPYTPNGEPQLCPNSCGSYFYPKGSGECPYCGKIC